MKTPREILLEEHCEAEPELDAIRRRVVDQACQRAEDGSLAKIAFWVRLLWGQLVVPSRPAWISLAAAWGIVATLSLARLEPASAGDSLASARETLLRMKPLLEEQAQLRTELFQSGGPLSPSNDSVGEVNPLGPRSDRRGNWGDQEVPAQAQPAAIERPSVG